jgi:tetratricopeptide (TPR) repeat protein
MMRGDGATALNIADHYRDRFPASGDTGFRAVIRAATWYAAGLHAPVLDVLAAPEPKGARMRAMRLYARGEAHARAGDAGAIRREASAMAQFRQGPEGRGLGSKEVEALVEMAEKVLEGRAAMVEGDPARAATAFRAAMKLQEGAGFGFDPPPFWYPVRRSLAAALLAGGDAEGARNQLIASLERWPGDPLALLALSRAEEALGRPEQAAHFLAQAKDGWAGEVISVPLTRI